MSEMFRAIAIIGGGKMGEAIGSGWLASDQGTAASIGPANITFVDPSEDRRAYLTTTYGVDCVADASELSDISLVILAVKPQIMFEVLPHVPNADLYVSIAAGIPTERLESALPEGASVVRVMPNLPLQVGCGASAVTPGRHATPAMTSMVIDLFSSLGVACQVDESLMDAVCGISGSGPAYVAWMIEALTDAGVTQGLPAEVSQMLALQTVWGTSELLRQTGQTPQALRQSVCSPGGTTLAALDAMDREGFTRVFEAGVDAAVRRSKELGA